MISPTKGITPQRALLTIAAEIALVIDEPMTVSQAWTGLRRWRETQKHYAPVTYAWFVLALDVLFALGALEYGDGMLSVVRRNNA